MSKQLNREIMKQLTKEQAIAFAESGEWKDFTDDEIVKVQLFQDRLCVDFSRFHEAIEKVLGRPVYTHEFGFVDSLRAEYLGVRQAPTFDEIMNLVPKEKRIIIGITEND